MEFRSPGNINNWITLNRGILVKIMYILLYIIIDNNMFYVSILSWNSVPIEPNRTELLVRFGFGSSNLSSGSGSVHQISVQVRVRFIKPWFRFGFGSSNLGSGSVRFNHVMLYFISKKKKCYYSICKKIVFRCH